MSRNVDDSTQPLVGKALPKVAAKVHQSATRQSPCLNGFYFSFFFSNLFFISFLNRVSSLSSRNVAGPLETETQRRSDDFSGIFCRTFQPFNASFLPLVGLSNPFHHSFFSFYFFCATFFLFTF